MAAMLSACGPRPQPAPKPAPVPAQPAAAPSPTATPVLQPAGVNTAPFTAGTMEAVDRTPALLRAQVLLDRAKFSPGVIDGKPGENVRQAVEAFQTARAMPVDGQLTQAVFDALVQADTAPVLKSYAITADDLKGPFLPTPDNLLDQSKMQHLGYQTIQEALAERFHMTEDLLNALNPGVDFNQAGAVITVAAAGDDTLPAKVASIEVNKGERAVRAYDDKGQLLAFYPATIGSTERPAPNGALKVANVAQNPTYVFDPSRLTFKPKGAPDKRTVVPSGPNNPVGAVWIGLSQPTFGIHGSDDPVHIGKTSSHGCIRLTNWDAEELASAVKAGVKVSFIGTEGGKSEAAKTKRT
jgi:lipoprotein-anchoring transpeptidase ErfK/SrfK